MWEKLKRCYFSSRQRHQRYGSGTKSNENAGKNQICSTATLSSLMKNLYVTHLIGSIYLSGSPGSVLHIVLLHLGTNFWTGSNVTCRLEEKKRGRRGKGQNRERGVLISKLGETAIKA